MNEISFKSAVVVNEDWVLECILCSRTSYIVCLTDYNPKIPPTCRFCLLEMINEKRKKL